MRANFSSQLDQLLVRLHTSAVALMSKLLLIPVISANDRQCFSTIGHVPDE